MIIPDFLYACFIMNTTPMLKPTIGDLNTRHLECQYFAETEICCKLTNHPYFFLLDTSVPFVFLA